ncbi:hypothetical protein C6P96_28820 [Burkholderia multivorans]|nr:hypothetical protein C6P95_21405 [Burkholderia multivorans]PRF05777.1 hypothetical protein C6P96_28820 [Burkholderia multivorans]
MVPYSPCCNPGTGASAPARAEPSKLRGFAGCPSGRPASRSFQGLSMTVDFSAYCPLARVVSGVIPTLIERSGARRQETCR